MNTKRILCVDDEFSIRLLLEETLFEYGYDVVSAHDGFKAKEIIYEEKININLVILDIKMPDMDGIEVLYYIRRRYPNLPVIFFTAYSGYENGIEGRLTAIGDSLGKRIEGKHDEYIVKSCDLEHLLSAIEKHCPLT